MSMTAVTAMAFMMAVSFMATVRRGGIGPTLRLGRVARVVVVRIVVCRAGHVTRVYPVRVLGQAYVNQVQSGHGAPPRAHEDRRNSRVLSSRRAC